DRIDAHCTLEHFDQLEASYNNSVAVTVTGSVSNVLIGLKRFKPSTHVYHDVYLAYSHTLVVDGTKHGDNIKIRQANGKVKVILNGQITDYPAADVTGVDVHGRAGSDIISIGLPVPASIYGDGENDRLTSGNGNDKLFGGNGN